MLQKVRTRFLENGQLVNLLRKLGLLKVAYNAREIIIVLDNAYTQKINPFATPVDDGTPLPNSWLMVKVAGHSHIKNFLRLGKVGVETLQNALQPQGLSLEDFHTVLDFGCGVGRVTRHLKPFSNLEIHGCDYNPSLIAWCKKNLPFATFDINQLAPPLPYPEEKFDLVYAFSVFTHLDEKLTQQWVHELARVLKPGGYLAFSTLGEAGGKWQKFSSEEWDAFRAGKLVVRYAEAAGMNLTGAFYNVDFVKKEMTHDLEFVDHIPEGALSNPPQDLVLMRKPGQGVKPTSNA